MYAHARRALRRNRHYLCRFDILFAIVAIAQWRRSVFGVLRGRCAYYRDSFKVSPSSWWANRVNALPVLFVRFAVLSKGMQPILKLASCVGFLWNDGRAEEEWRCPSRMKCRASERLVNKSHVSSLSNHPLRPPELRQIFTIVSIFHISLVLLWKFIILLLKVSLVLYWSIQWNVLRMWIERLNFKFFENIK